ncbi:hypothetical protein NDU88_005057 [Pleurodeles waltl]|uniref:Uncharacterized protein n=1 Tax=Pleurodeles waltl TaxID=8319 RepID=A0AAV7VHY7_PLEWA|nr:hypothetical protein NDU88_005057 [Pleurodeles waltl]
MAPSTSAATSRPPNDQGQSSGGGGSRPDPQDKPSRQSTFTSQGRPRISDLGPPLYPHCIWGPAPSSKASVSAALRPGEQPNPGPPRGSVRCPEHSPASGAGPRSAALCPRFTVPHDPLSPLTAHWAAAPLPISGGLRPFPPPVNPQSSRVSVFWGQGGGAGTNTAAHAAILATPP